MAAEISSGKKRKRRDFMKVLSSAACEWFLIFLLFVDAAFSYLLTKFAEYCELKTPCLLCSRSNLVIWDKKPRSYQSILCSDHIEEISSLVTCSVHSKLADVNGMCEECITSIAMKNKSDCDSYRLLVGKLLVDIERCVLQNLMLNKNIRLVSSGERTCSCCNRTWKAKPSTERLHELTSIGIGASKANVKPPLPRVPGRSRFSRRDSFKRLRDKFTGQVKNQPVRSKSVDSLSHAAYAKMTLTSDSDSEVPLSDDDDDGNSGLRGRKHNTENSSVHTTTTTDSVLSEKQGITSVLDQSDTCDVSQLENKKLVTPDELKSHSNLNLTQMAELISLGDGTQPPVVGGLPFDVSVDTNNDNAFFSHIPNISAISELLSVNNPLLTNIGTEQPNVPNVVETSYEENISLTRNIAAETGCSSEQVSGRVSNDTNLTDTSSPNNEGIEPIVVSDSTKIEDIKSLQQVCSPEKDLTLETTSPKVYSEFGAFQKFEESIPHALPDSASLERHESSSESLDGITVSEIEGESVIDRLKRQIACDKSCMSALYKELEEERNAAAIAANETMAMITRLQEEKAALHMEALQYLRMMEEQAEHDMEALERANELLAEKEKEVQDLEFELEFYTGNFLDESMAEDPAGPSDSNSTDIFKGNGKHRLANISILNFEDERLYISECLKKLEEELHQAATNGISNDMQNGIISKTFTNEVDDLDNTSVDRDTRLDEHNKNNGSPFQKDVSGSNGSPMHERNATLDSNRGKLNVNRGRTNLDTLEKGIADLHDRLEALESDCDLLKHAFNMLRNGKDGLQFIREIAHQLQELRKIELKKRCISIP